MSVVGWATTKEPMLGAEASSSKRAGEPRAAIVAARMEMIVKRLDTNRSFASDIPRPVTWPAVHKLSWKARCSRLAPERTHQ
jgi:hypothetical protein